MIPGIAEKVKAFREKYGHKYGMEQSKNMVIYNHIRKQIEDLKERDFCEPIAYSVEEIVPILNMMLRFCAPNECTGEDCSCHKQKVESNKQEYPDSM